MAGSGVNRLARVLQQRMLEISGHAAPLIGMATITENGIETDDEELQIPSDDLAYLETQEDPETGQSGHITYRTGDRVLIAYIGNDIIILGKVV